MPLARSPAPPFWWWSKSPVAGSERPPMSTRDVGGGQRRLRRGCGRRPSGPWTRPSTATAKTSSAWKLPGWVATRIRRAPGTLRAGRRPGPTGDPAARRSTRDPEHVDAAPRANASRSSTTRLSSTAGPTAEQRPRAQRDDPVLPRGSGPRASGRSSTRDRCASRRWWTSKSASERLRLGHPEAAERAPLVLARSTTCRRPRGSSV